MSDRSPENDIRKSEHNLEICSSALMRSICYRCMVKPKHCKECGIEAMLAWYGRAAREAGYLSGVADMRDAIQRRGPADRIQNGTD